ncbi:MAG TPA: HPP family protein [Casimicrobiaceae bacterium]|jgi:CBS-domain-containing membrane protein
MNDVSPEPPKSAMPLRAVIRLIACAAGASLALYLVLEWVDPPNAPLFFASLGGSAVFLFGLTRAPAAQPRALFGGHLSGALIGVLCAQFLGDAAWVYVVSLALTLVVMLATRTVHPPAGANPLIMVHAHAGLVTLWMPVFIGVTLLAIVAALWTRLVPGMIHYPHRWFEESPPSITWGGWVE